MEMVDHRVIPKHRSRPTTRQDTDLGFRPYRSNTRKDGRRDDGVSQVTPVGDQDAPRGAFHLRLASPEPRSGAKNRIDDK
jgi:hypothetical protein